MNDAQLCGAEEWVEGPGTDSRKERTEMLACHLSRPAKHGLSIGFCFVGLIHQEVEELRVRKELLPAHGMLNKDPD